MLTQSDASHLPRSSAVNIITNVCRSLFRSPEFVDSELPPCSDGFRRAHISNHRPDEKKVGQSSRHFMDGRAKTNENMLKSVRKVAGDC